ncbi:hypothetical protein N7509_011516 [Penicillium cosmopolitanum]|uniref:MARVEL domain-containing protein n=1 Tax=Penicillium cosmopolitanum TaxID=1131564 RepID=A0A9W9SGV5_9EURO|nr:uncharacterized protein N7509_011516 [Penicillium cosmopolitanum]KAJ5378397.1 hypothetical protein N7509_011516 [Penicillium cosmopolitanum]
MTPKIPYLADGQMTFFLLCNRVIQWLSSEIVLGITVPIHQRWAVGSVVKFLPAFVSPFLTIPVKDFVVFIDVIFSYLWLAAFIFSAVDYNQNNCNANASPGVACSKKWANKALIFLVFLVALDRREKPPNLLKVG